VDGAFSSTDKTVAGGWVKRHPPYTAEFPEGVRTRLIDKDHTPHRHWPDVANIPDEAIEAHFAPVSDGEHPLADL
jgi:hypothetical protein